MIPKPEDERKAIHGEYVKFTEDVCRTQPDLVRDSSTRSISKPASQPASAGY